VTAKPPLRILLLEDNPSDAELIRELLEADHFVCQVNRVQTRAEFQSALGNDGIDLILADYQLPSFDGLSALKLAHDARPNLPFIFVSGTLGEEVAIEALKIGATDYVLKTRLSRLVPSVHRALREAEERVERKKAEEALDRGERELRQVIETIPAMVWSALPDASNVLMNSRWAEYTGSSAAGLGWQAAVHPDDLKRHMEAFLACSAAGLPLADEVRFRRADGEYRWFLVQGMPLRDQQGNILKWYGVVTDIEDRKLAEEAARRSERELRDVIETVPTAAWTALPDGSVDFVNRQWLEYTGLSAEDASASGWQVAVHPGDLQRHVDKWHVSLATGQPFENEVRYRRAADGEYRWYLARAVPLRDEQGKILKWYGISTDIDDRKRAESLLTGEKRILEMVAKGDSLAEILDALCRLVEKHASGALASILLLDGDRLSHGSAPDLPKAFTDAMDGTAIGPSAGSCGTAAYRGEQVIVGDIATDPLWANYRDLALPYDLRACWSTPVLSSQRKVIATFAMYYREPRRPSQRDQEIIEQITHLAGVAIERKLTQEALRRSEAYLAEAQRLTHTGSWAYKVEGSLYWSEENCRIWGIDLPQDRLNLETVLQRVHPEDRDRVRENLEKTVRERKDHDHEFRIVLSNGTVRHLHAVGHPVYSASGELMEVVGTHVDVTERKRAEEERERVLKLEVELAHMNRVSTMGELAASLAHEIKQPISAAMTNARTSFRWLQRDPPEIEEARQTASRVVADVNRAAEIINHLQCLYKKDAPTEREWVDVNQIAREMLVLMRTEAHRYSISMRTELAVDLPEITADRVQLQQVFMNLMLNGIEAMKVTGGELTIRSERTTDGYLLISIKDTGVGLPTEKVDQIFSAFFTTKSQGTGMGLSISRTIVESHGGRLWAAANSGQGATFHFTLPTHVRASSTSAA
jgi:PAS domain S-box-containing protein